MSDFKGWTAEVGTISLIDIIDDLGVDGKRGAITTFTGVVREDSDASSNKVVQIEVETWEENTSESMQSIAKRLGSKYNLLGLRIVHLFGIIELGEPIVFIVISSAHRKEAFDSLEEIIHAYKNESPVWKKEIYNDGTSNWITTAKSMEK